MENLVMVLSDHLPHISGFKVHRLIQHELYFLIRGTVLAIQGKFYWPFSKLQKTCACVFCTCGCAGASCQKVCEHKLHAVHEAFCRV